MAGSLESRAPVTSTTGLPEMSPRHLRVLGYLGLHLNRHGYLPTTAELAKACRLRSTSTAHAIVRDLENYGLLTREGPHSRQARLAPAVAPDPDADDADLWVLLRVLEMQSLCELRWSRDGLSLTGELELLDWVLLRAQQHLARLRAYEHVRVLLQPPNRDTTARLGEIDEIMTRAATSYNPLKNQMDTWFTYSALGNAATGRISRNIIEHPSLAALHLAVDVDEDMSSRTDWRYCSRALHAGDATVEAAALEIVDISNEATTALRRHLSDRFVDVIPAQAAYLLDILEPAGAPPR